MSLTAPNFASVPATLAILIAGLLASSAAGACVAQPPSGLHASAAVSAGVLACDAGLRRQPVATKLARPQPEQAERRGRQPLAKEYVPSEVEACPRRSWW